MCIRDIVLAGENLCRREEFIGRVSSALPVVGEITQTADDAVLDDVEVVLALRRQ